MSTEAGIVFIVDDVQDVRNLLDAAGFSSIAYASAEALIADDRIEDALCVISDIKLPAMSGFELLVELRARGASPPMILITANDTARARNKAKRYGAAAYFAKPFPGGELTVSQLR
jgi:FixJ family two-component response regulator